MISKINVGLLYLPDAFHTNYLVVLENSNFSMKILLFIFTILDLADEELQAQNSERKVQHLQLLTDLRTLQTQASKIWHDIGEFSTQY